MEKIAIQIWKNSNIDEENFKKFLINEVPHSLKDHISSYQVNLADEDVKDAAGLIQSCYPPSPNVIIFLKVKNFFHFEF